MKGSIEYRLTRLVEQLAKSSASKIRVTHADGHTEYLTAGECIDLIMGDVSGIGRFEAVGPGNGLLSDLLNALLEI